MATDARLDSLIEEGDDLSQRLRDLIEERWAPIRTMEVRQWAQEAHAWASARGVALPSPGNESLTAGLPQIDAYVARVLRRLRLLQSSATTDAQLNRPKPRGGNDDNTGGLAGANIKDCYQLETQVGAGASGSVYIARVLGATELASQGDRVAIKVYAGSEFQKESWPKRRKRIDSEFALARTHTHPNLIRAYELLQAQLGGEDRWCLVMEYIDGPNLHDWVEENGAPTREEWLRMARELVSATGHIADLGLVHRDIKPANILVTKENHLKLGDFGVVMREAGTRITSTDATLGTLRYMPPEYLFSGEIDNMDTYGLGAVLFLLATGKDIYADVSRWSLLVREIESAPAFDTRIVDSNLEKDDVGAFIYLSLSEMLSRSPRPSLKEIRERFSLLLDSPWWCDVVVRRGSTVVAAVLKCAGINTNHWRVPAELSNRAFAAYPEVNRYALSVRDEASEECAAPLLEQLGGIRTLMSSVEGISNEAGWLKEFYFQTTVKERRRLICSFEGDQWPLAILCADCGRVAEGEGQNELAADLKSLANMVGLRSIDRLRLDEFLDEDGEIQDEILF